MTDLDDLLSMVENPTRRRILEALVAEPRYPLQLSKELGVSQQAVMKNLTLLERHGLVMSHRESSTMGPMRTVYSPNTEFTIVIDMHNRMFTTRLIRAEEHDDEKPSKTDIDKAIGRVRELETRLESLERERIKLIRERNRLLDWLNENMNGNNDNAHATTRYIMMEGRTSTDGGYHNETEVRK